MMSKIVSYFLSFLLFCLIGCFNEPTSINSIKNYLSPKYGQVSLKVMADTLTFTFKDTLYYKIKSFNVFKSDNIEYIAFFDGKELDDKQMSILIYNFNTKKYITNIQVTRFISNPSKFFTTAYVTNFDSIFIFNDKSMQLFDSMGVLKKKIDFLNAKPQIQFYKNGNPPIFVQGKLYTGVKPPVVGINFKSLKEQGILYEFNMDEGVSSLHYSFPPIYFNNYYGYPYLNSSYCYNNNNRFVFSFPADSSIYETDLKDYNINYYGKSLFQFGGIAPITEEEASQEGPGKRNYAFNDAYGSIYFDRSKKRYLRVALRKMSEVDYRSKRNRLQSMIIFNEQLRIIGETPVLGNINLERLLFLDDGAMYAELILPKPRHDIRFVRLEYDDKFKQLHLK